MRHLWRILILIWRAERAALLRGVALSITVLVMGLALLGLSGWFITAAGLAGLMGLGATFDIFRPSAGVRFLAIGRTAARYGERILNHDATLRALAALRIRLMRALAGQGWDRLGRLRGSEMLNRLGADVDTLDGAMLRLAIPAVAAAVTLSFALVVMSLLTTPLLALASVGSFTLGGGLALGWVAVHARKPSRRAGRAVQALRIRMIDLLRAKADLAVMGRLAGARDSTLAASARLEAARAASDTVEHRAIGRLGITTTIATTIALLLGAVLARAGLISAPQAALGFFVMLALAETLAPLRRGLTELGAMLDAAARVDQMLQNAAKPGSPVCTTQPDPMAPALETGDLRYRYPGAATSVVDGFALCVQPGEAVALMGRSGSGKSTVLHLAAGLITPERGTLRLAGQPLTDWTEEALRNHVGLLPQRSTLMRGSIAEVLRLGAPDAPEADLWAVLEAVQLDRVITERGGLSASLAEAGAGLSGGEARRLALARLLLRRPRVLLLDEPTEGLDDATADRVMTGLRAFAPRATILTATHRPPPAKGEWRIVAMGGKDAGEKHVFDSHQGS